MTRGVFATFLLLQLPPASSFGGAPLTRPPFNSGSKPGSAVASTATHATSPSGQAGEPTPFGAKAGLFASPARSRRHGRANGALWAGGSKDGDVKDKATETKPAAKKSSSPGGMGGWDWGFTSTSKKTTPKKTADKPKKPVFSADDEAAEIEAVKRKAAAEIKAEQEEAKGKKATKMAVAEVPETVAALEEADEIAEIKRRAAAEVEAEKAKAKANNKEEEAKFAEAVAARVALRKRAEEMAAMARGDIPKPRAPAAKKPDVKKTPAEAKPAKAVEPSKAADGSLKAEPAKAEPTKAEPTEAEPAKVATPAKAPAKKSSGAGLGGWDWGFTPSTKSAAAKANPAAAPAKTKTEKPKPKEAAAKPEKATAAAAAAAAAAKEEKAAAAENEKAAKEKVEKEKAEKEKAAAAKADKDKAEKENAENAKAEAAAARAAQEKRAEEMAAKARGDVPEPKKKAAPKVKKATAGAATTDAKTKEASPGDAKAEDAKAVEPKKTEAEKPAEPTKKETKKPAEPKKKEAEKPVVKKVGLWGTTTREVAAPSSLMPTKPETIVVVTGATGRVGSLAVRRLLELYPKVLVRAIVNDLAKGNRLLQEEKDKYGIKLEIMSAELGGKRSAAKVVEGASAVVFCASGFAQNLSPIQRLANAVRLTINPSSVADVEGVRDVALALKETKKILSKVNLAKQDAKSGAKEGEDEPQPLSPNAPRFVLLSSAAVTRPNWSSEEKNLYPLAADVPIVKLNPLNILTVKAEGEKELREVGIPYAVVRPCGLNDDHPRGRPLFSVGDTAAGRICREDVADVLVRCLGTKEATGKTFEVQSLPGFEKVAASNPKSNKSGIDQALSSLPTDEALKGDPELLQNYRRFSYPVLTQLRPVPLAQTPKEEE